MLRITTALTGLGLIATGVVNLTGGFSYDWMEIGVFSAMIAVGGCVLAYAANSNVRPGRTLLGIWIDLKRAEMQAKHDAIVKRKD